MFAFYFSTRVEFGVGCRKRLIDVLLQNKWSRVGVVVDGNLVSTPMVQQLLGDLRDGCEKTVVAECHIAEPTYEYLESIRSSFTGLDLQVVVGMGGGSAMDVAKGMAVLILNREPAITYRGFDKMTAPVMPVIAIPTTAGTGSEVTPNASFIDSAAKKKMGINGEAVRPRYAFIDPELTLSCPAGPSLSAGVDSMVHAIEAVAAKKGNPMATLFACEGFRLVFGNLIKVLGSPDDIAAREEVMLGAFMSGVALMNSGTGPAAALSYPLGVHYKVPHGIGGGIFLPHVVRYNVEQGFAGYAPFFDALHPDEHTLSEAEKSRRFAREVEEMWERLGVPRDLTKYGLKPEGIPSFVAETMELKGALDQNPLPFYESQIEGILKKLVAGPAGSTGK